MEIKQFNEIPILEFGNDYIITGMLYTNHSGNSVVITLPQEHVDKDSINLINPSREEWDKLIYQVDTNGVEVLVDGQLTILRKSQRNMDSKIMWNVVKRDDYKCRYCAIDFVPLTVDHVITWETGGATHEDILLCSCRKCNKTRGNMDYQSWLQSPYYLNKMKYLDNETIIKNAALIAKLPFLPRVQTIRNR